MYTNNKFIQQNEFAYDASEIFGVLHLLCGMLDILTSALSQDQERIFLKSIKLIADYYRHDFSPAFHNYISINIYHAAASTGNNYRIEIRQLKKVTLHY